MKGKLQRLVRVGSGSVLAVVGVLSGLLVEVGICVAATGDDGTLAPAAAPAPDIIAGGAAQGRQDLSEPERERVDTAFGKLPLYFIENRGQLDERVAYYVKGSDKVLYFTREGVTFSLQGEDERWTVNLEFVGANADVVPRGADKQEAIFSYFKGKPEDWKTGCPTYAKVVYEDLWPGIDLVYSGTVDRLKYEFVVEPGADPARIRLEYQGATRVTVTEAGTLEIATPVARFEDARPCAYQMSAGVRSDVEVTFARRDAAGESAFGFGFSLGDFDPALPLAIDPEMLIYCGYIGGVGGEWGWGIAVDGAGAAYVMGATRSTQSSFPVTVGPDLTYNGESYDAFVAKLKPQGTGLVYCGYIGGAMSEWGYGIAVDAAGAAYVTGSTYSDQSSFPVKVGPDLTYNGGDYDAFVAKVTSDGTDLAYCGYVGGLRRDEGFGIAVDSAGAAYVTGSTDSPHGSFPVTVGPDLTYNGGGDAFVAKVTSQGTGLLYCGYVGGASYESGCGIAVDATGAAYVSGHTFSDESSFPVTVGPDLTSNGGRDAFVAKVATGGTSLVYCGYVGGADDDVSFGIGVDAATAAYLAGYTFSDQSSFPVTVGPDLTFNGGYTDAFVAKITSNGARLGYCGYVGGAQADSSYSIAVDASGAAYVTGYTRSDESSFPVWVGPDLTSNGELDTFVAKITNDGTGLPYCGYIGGASEDWCYGIAVDAAGAAYVTGKTSSYESSFPVTVGPDLTYNGGEEDAFVAKVPALDLFPASWTNYCTGWPGTNGIPCLTASDDPVLCSFITLAICNSLGAPTSAFLFIGLAPASIPTPFGGTLCVLPRWVYPLFLLSPGTTILPGQIPCDHAFAGVDLYLQVLEMDPGASHGISFTPGLELVFGYW
ncbi:MAG: SBBP repeat-containing protein [Planctomycetota bacterium]